MITIVDYGMGNLGSIINMFKYINVEATVESDPDKIKNASKILLPGVGAFDVAMKKIKEKNLLEVLNEKALKEQIPILGICLGMQLLVNGSDEGVMDGLQWIDGRANGFKDKIAPRLKSPHMGWNLVKIKNQSDLLLGFDALEELRFYFVHSYFVLTSDDRNSILKTNYGLEFDSAIQKNNIYGAQFHPEKSHKYGIKLFENFARL